MRVELVLRWTASGVVRWRDVEFTHTQPTEPRIARVATVNYRPTHRTKGPEENRELFGRMIDKAAAHKPDFIILGEGITLVGTGRSYVAVAEPIPGPSTAFLGTLSKKYACHIVAGLYERDGPAVYNTSVLIGPDGAMIGKYRKTCLPREEIEGGITPGVEYPVFDTRLGRVGMMICWDLTFPEVARRLAVNGAELILVPIWGGFETLAKARAIENQVHVVTSSYNPKMPSAVFDPYGEQIAVATSDQPIAVAEIDLNKRHLHSWLGDLKARIPRERPAADHDLCAEPCDGRPRVFILDADALVRAKERIAAGDESLQPALRALLDRADAALKEGPYSVMDKEIVPPSGDKHDYISLSGYWWPDPTKPDGKPYIRRDGETNPEYRQYDRPVRGEMTSAVETLGLAFFFTDRAEYANHAARLLRVWFLDEATRMNPHLRYGGFIPGTAPGRCYGICDTRCFVRLIDAVGMLQGSKAWTEKDQQGLVSWMRAYRTWLVESDLGKQEAGQPNNHGTHYDVQVVTYALFAGDTAAAKKQLTDYTMKRIASQIEPDGRQPWELKRTLSFGYSLGNLDGLFNAATLAEHVGLDLWRYETQDGRGIRKALDWVCRYADGTEPWPYQSLGGVPYRKLLPLLRRAAVKYDDPRYEALIDKLPGATPQEKVINLMYPKPAIGILPGG